MNHIDNREWQTICIGGCDVNRIYKVLKDGRWLDMRIPFRKEYRINGTLCPACQEKRDKEYESKQRFPYTDRWKVLRSYGHDERGCV